MKGCLNGKGATGIGKLLKMKGKALSEYEYSERKTLVQLGETLLEIIVVVNKKK